MCVCVCLCGEGGGAHVNGHTPWVGVSTAWRPDVMLNRCAPASVDLLVPAVSLTGARAASLCSSSVAFRSSSSLSR